MIAAASFDGSCKVFSAIHTKVDTEAPEGPFAEVTSFGKALFKFNCMYWLNHVSFDPTGTVLCYASHDGTLNFCDVSGGDKGEVTKFTHFGLPFTKGKFLSDSTYLAVGYEKAPFLIVKEDGAWKETKCLDEGFAETKDFSKA